MLKDKPINMLSIDVEDYFHVSAFETVSPSSSWEKREWRVEKNTEEILALLDNHDVKATFFVLGWVAERHHLLIKRIAGEGHEVASHGYNHERVTKQSRVLFREDLRRSKCLLEDIIGDEIIGYRAPSFSISPATYWAFDELHAAGYHYDSSIFAISHDFYGMANWPRFIGTAVRRDDGSWLPSESIKKGQKSLFEVPITTLLLAGRELPIAGGGYFRLYPYEFTRWGLQRINHVDAQPFVFYLHPWEIDPKQPRMKGAGWKSRVRHYLNLGLTEMRFKRLLTDFAFLPIRDFLPEPKSNVEHITNCTTTAEANFVNVA